MSCRQLSLVGLLALAPLLLAGPAAAADWQIVQAESWLGFTGMMAGVIFEGRFGHWTARITFDAAQAERGHAAVTIDMGSVATGDPEKDAALPRSDWFDARTFPNAMFEVRSFRPKSGTSYEAIGVLTIRNVKKEVVLPMTIEVNGTHLHASGKLEWCVPTMASAKARGRAANGSRRTSSLRLT